MTDEELKNKCTERAKIFQQAMESCHSSSLIDCIEWFADRIAELENENAELKENFFVARCVRSGCPYLHLETRNCLKVGGFFTAVSNKHCPMMQNLNSSIQLTKAKELLKRWLQTSKASGCDNINIVTDTEQFLNSEVEK